MAFQSLDVINRSASTSTPPQARGALEVAKLIDISKCIGCKACQSACMEWNDLRDEVGINPGHYDNPADLTAQSWTVMRFYEEELPADKGLAWLIVKDGCLHCAEPGCLKACPAPGAIVQYANGIVDFQQDQCIGCGYCQTGCPFNIPRYSMKDQKAYKCTLCSDRVSVGLEPACVKTCPTGALAFGTKTDMKDLAGERLVELKSRGFEKAALYDPSGVGGTHVLFVLPHGDPELYRLPKDPRVSPLVALWRSGVAKTLGVLTMVSVVVAGIFHYMKVGPIEVDEDHKENPS
ncbi:formate dehydrogenase subunit beta [Anaeromyxobacter dehalogenans]|uniref:Formate dehydrogenase (Quinone-dependent) iron-sulfur subunit n=1 Tax=Anaeromyxobacter dehalogenans (strain 2CP-C) TaxID=290397 RepID=Q2IG16_ANADE|nr:formate dehydrogenase subunit beta [Anaeromyxobacter dehalogenans]ABC83521.1 formate dehydrogenase (quinone-dependent) iron-sulfur subunit [Anaeromyxobacter dehalogenans 2CP-C]